MKTTKIERTETEKRIENETITSICTKLPQKEIDGRIYIDTGDICNHFYPSESVGHLGDCSVMRK
jgi:hypothetical protein